MRFARFYHCHVGRSGYISSRRKGCNRYVATGRKGSLSKIIATYIQRFLLTNLTSCKRGLETLNGKGGKRVSASENYRCLNGRIYDSAIRQFLRAATGCFISYKYIIWRQNEFFQTMIDLCCSDWVVK
jgi:hypothetical protein